MGRIVFADGIGRQAIGLVDSLHEAFSIQFLQSGAYNLHEVPANVAKVVKKRYITPAKVLIFEDCLPTEYSDLQLPNTKIKIAYSMVESTKIPEAWVKMINEQFDAVAVPDQFLIAVYRNCGVKVPIFEVPLGVYIAPFLERHSQKSRKHDRPFIFGSLGKFDPRKNQLSMIKAFAKAFKNDPNVQLVLNGRAVDNYYDYFFQIKEFIESEKITNVLIGTDSLSWNDYVERFSHFDCYVNCSTGEGFSIGPREAIAMGIPAIITNNTAQMTICETGYVRPVASLHEIPAYYRELPGEDAGVQFECSVDDLAEAMREVYANYELFAAKVAYGRDWANKYSLENVKNYYETLILPQQVILSDRNEIHDGIVYTDSPSLYEKYGEIHKEKNLFRKFMNYLIIKRYQ